MDKNNMAPETPGAKPSELIHFLIRAAETWCYLLGFEMFTTKTDKTGIAISAASLLRDGCDKEMTSGTERISLMYSHDLPAAIMMHPFTGCIQTEGDRAVDILPDHPCNRLKATDENICRVESLIAASIPDTELRSISVTRHNGVWCMNPEIFIPWDSMDEFMAKAEASWEKSHGNENDLAFIREMIKHCMERGDNPATVLDSMQWTNRIQFVIQLAKDLHERICNAELDEKQCITSDFRTKYEGCDTDKFLAGTNIRFLKEWFEVHIGIPFDTGFCRDFQKGI